MILVVTWLSCNNTTLIKIYPGSYCKNDDINKQLFRSYTAIIPESCIDPLTQTQFEKPDSSSQTSFSQNCYAKPSTYQFR